MEVMSEQPQVREPLRFRLARASRAAAAALRTRHPGFVFGLAPPAEEIPVFRFHDVDARAFSRQLEFLRLNGYRTLTLAEFLAATRRKSAARGAREVLLTFDDARASFYGQVLPLLRAFGAHAVLFAPTRWMRPTGQAGAGRFMSWEQLRECLQSGLVDVESHAHRHALVFESEHLTGFATPARLARSEVWDWPMRHESDGDVQSRPAAGTPIYRANPLLSARRRYLENATVREACISLVERSGGARVFFSRPDCYVRLLSLHRTGTASLPGRYLGEREFDSLLASEFESSRAAFEQHLGFAPRALAHPWRLGSARSLELARRFGLRCAFGVATDYGRARARALPLPVFGRLTGEWLELLPGSRRARLLPVLARKVASFGDQHLAH
ncbi:MAG TPA: polysaccharide deacetylase family protein [Steroidobacteraceae bacterium]|nr:polysaccharide deacetylase family protein [Steroidobacteraceae bacterium]